MTTTVDGMVSVRAIAKTFASGKTEKLVYQTLAELGLPSGKVCLWLSLLFSTIWETSYYAVFLTQSTVTDLICLQSDSIDLNVFTFDKFLQIYKIICPRSDIDDLFESM